MDPNNSSPASPVEAPVSEAPVTEAPIVETPVESNPFELDSEMTQEQEDAYVAQVLGHKVPTPVEAPVEPVEPVIEELVVPKEEPVVEEPKVEKPEEKVETSIEDIKTDDLFIELNYKVEDDEGELVDKTVKLTYNPADPDSFIPDDLAGLSVKQISKIMETKSEMAELYKERVAEHDEALTKVNDSKSEQAQIASWDNEIATLQDAGLLDKEQKTIDAVFEHMTRTNIDRAEKGLPPIVSFGTVLSMYNKDGAEAKAKEAKDKENADAKTKGAMVGGGSAASTGAVESSIYVAGSARSIHDIKVAS